MDHAASCLSERSGLRRLADMGECREVRFINLVDPPAAIEYSQHGQALVPLDPLTSVLDLGGYHRVSVCVGSTRARSCELVAGRLAGASHGQRFVVPLDGQIHSFEVVGPQLALWLNGGAARSSEKVQVSVYLHT